MNMSYCFYQAILLGRGLTMDLLITTTGYRSHFIHRTAIEHHGGAVAYVKAWLDHAAHMPDWKSRAVAPTQLSLF
jgi:hypothetical protein